MTEIKQELIEEQVMPGTSSGGGEEKVASDINSDIKFDDKFITQYCDSVDMPKVMTISKELKKSDEMVTRRYEQLSDKDKSRFNQMKDLTKAIKRDTGNYGLIEDLMVQVIAQRFGHMDKDTVTSVMGPKGEGLEGGKALERSDGMLKIKKKLGPEPDRVVVMVIIPNEDSAIIPYHIVEDEQASNCVTISSEDSDIEEIEKPNVKKILKDLAEIRHKEAECIDHLAEAVPNMRESKIVIVTKKVQREELPRCVYDMYGRISDPRNFRAALAVGK